MVTVDSVGLKISEKKLGTLVTIQVADISSIDVRPAAITPKIALIATKVPSIWIGVTHDGAEATIALTPLISATGVATAEQAQAFATELAAKLGALRK